ncbi:energy-coupling factor transporter transmembrane component T [Branchiibius sp. NY16-3462-2]|uniref:energy-coupling factor transporter transmembrane component T n=1 Tax=Branchiibius sp. NY16-3462-2 TaxID=1807500 RepID=UPI00079385E3|nr:energy-coupling factor transporter transmembrane component T [Branchiibius sp. NY16-3462-2]KYH44012.1 hypothetical protein AZH51_04510 [Branchiibius sp. NY16-3462-2]
MARTLHAASVVRSLHPGAWWAWAICVAAAVSQITNPLLLALAMAAVIFVVLSRRTDAPWARAFRWYFYLGAFVIATRVVLYILVGAKTGETVLVRLPTIHMPGWAAGIQLLGPVSVEGLVVAFCEGLRLAAMFLCFGAANALANPRRLLRLLPSALRDVGTAVVVAVSVVPTLVLGVGRVTRAQQLRGDLRGGIHRIRRIGLPLMEETLERSLALAAAMDSRGYGALREQSRTSRLTTGAVTFLGLIGVCVGLFGLLDQGDIPLRLSLGLLIGGLGLGVAGIALAGRKNPVTIYRPDPWGVPEALTLECGLWTVALVYAAVSLHPDAASMPTEPLGVPAVPLLALLGFLVAALPGVLTPDPMLDRDSRGARDEVVNA